MSTGWFDTGTMRKKNISGGSMNCDHCGYYTWQTMITLNGQTSPLLHIQINYYVTRTLRNKSSLVKESLYLEMLHKLGSVLFQHISIRGFMF